MISAEIDFTQITELLLSRKDLLISKTLNIIGAGIVLWLGLKIIRVFSKKISSQLNKTNIDVTLRPFITTLLSWMFRIMLFITVAGMIGIQTTSFVAVLGAAGLAIGLALQGSLSNFAGGTLLLIFRPYKVGDLIEISGQTGHVTEIQIFNTIVLTPENKTIILPNGQVAGGTIINYSTMGKMRIDIPIILSGNSNLMTFRNALNQIMDDHPQILKDPEPSIKIHQFEGGDLKLTIMPWANPDEYWEVYWDIMENINGIVNSNNDISFPTPNMEIIMNKS